MLREIAQTELDAIGYQLRQNLIHLRGERGRKGGEREERGWDGGESKGDRAREGGKRRRQGERGWRDGGKKGGKMGKKEEERER